MNNKNKRKEVKDEATLNAAFEELDNTLEESAQSESSDTQDTNGIEEPIESNAANETDASSDVDMFNLTSDNTAADLTETAEDEENVSRTRTKVAVLPKRLTEKYAKKGNDEKKSWFEPAGYTEGVSTIHSVLKTVVYIIFITITACFLAYFAITRVNDLYAFNKPADEVEITIPENATVNEITDILYDAGIIEYPNFFKLYAELKNASERYSFKAGSYVVNPMMNYDELFLKLEGTIDRSIKRITIPEGYNVDEIIALFVKEGLGTKEGFENVIQNYDFEYDFIKAIDEKADKNRKYRLEGYLYPDTYEVYTGKSEAYYIYKLLDRFEEIFIDRYKTRAEELGLTIDEIITIASLVEREAKNPADFEAVACIFHNRLNDSARFPKLESDATVVYAIQIATGEKITKVTPEHLKFNSPYNTYLVDGLTPGPISNPGYQAITSALFPGESSYYYFVTSLEGDVFLASTYSDHQSNIKKVDALDKEYLENQQ